MCDIYLQSLTFTKIVMGVNMQRKAGGRKQGRYSHSEYLNSDQNSDQCETTLYRHLFKILLYCLCGCMIVGNAANH